MNYPNFFRIALVALIPMVALPAARAQTPAPSSPAPSATPAPPPAETKSPGALPSTAPPAPTPPPAPAQTSDPFGEQVSLTPKTVVVTKGTANWDTAFDTLLESLKTLTATLEKQGT